MCWCCLPWFARSRARDYNESESVRESWVPGKDDEPKSARSIGEKSIKLSIPCCCWCCLQHEQGERRENKNGLRHGRHISDDVSSFVCDEASRASSAETTTAADRPAHTYIRSPHPSIHLPARPNNQTEQTSFIYTLHDTPSPPCTSPEEEEENQRKQEKKLCIG